MKKDDITTIQKKFFAPGNLVVLRKDIYGPLGNYGDVSVDEPVITMGTHEDGPNMCGGIVLTKRNKHVRFCDAAFWTVVEIYE